MKVAFITRSTLDTAPGGDTIQIKQTADQLRNLGIQVDILSTTLRIDYSFYDLLHFFNIIRPADILYHISRSNKPFVLSPILIDYSEYDRQHRKGISGFILRLFSADTNEYIKAISRWIKGKDSLPAKAYIWKGHKRSIQEILQKTEMILPDSQLEYDRLKKLFSINKPYSIVPYAIDENLFCPDNSVLKDEKLILCAARIEGIKNQFNLIKALNNTDFKLLLIGDASPNQQNYYRRCRQIAAGNIEFTGRLSQEDLVNYYKKAKVHILPSWFETCGLSSMEAAAMGCNIVITDRGYTREYFGDSAVYCDPGKPESIYNAVVTASKTNPSIALQKKIFDRYTWKHAATITLEAYKKTGKSVSSCCPLCGEKGYVVVYKILREYPGAAIVKCSHCFHVYTVLNQEHDKDKLYSDDVYKLVENRNSLFDRILNWEYNRVLKKIQTLKRPKGALLDFGCGKGKFGNMAKNKGWQVKCVETAIERADYAKNIYGLEVNTNYYTTGKIFNNDFDILTLFHVLEHLPNPKILLTELIKYNLAKGGLIVMEVPNFRSLQARIAGSKWMHLDAYRHISHFTPEKLDGLARELNLKTVSKSSFSFQLGVLGMTDSFLKLFGYRKNIIYELKNKRKFGLLFCIALLMPFSLIFEICASATGQGGIIRKYFILNSKE